MIKKDFKICPVTKFIAWLILGLIVCIIGISNVFADTYIYNQFTAQLYDNYAPTLSAVTTDQTNGRWQGAIPTMTANSAGAAWGISSNMVLLADHTYTLTAQITGTYGGRLVLSTYNRIGVGTTLANAKTSYQNNSNVNENYSRVLDDGYTIQFAFTPTTNGSYIVFPFATNYTGSNQYFYLSNYTIEDLGSSGGVSESTINNSLNSQTNVLNQSITNSQNAIIQNQNENNQALIDSNKELLGNCNKNLISSNPVSLSGRNYNYSISLDNGKTYNISTNGNIAICIHSGDFNCIDTLIFNTYGDGSYASNYNIIGTSNSLYLSASSGTGWGNYDITSSETMLSLGNSPTSFLPYGTEKCTSKLDETNNAINNLNDTLNDDTAPTFDTSSISISPNTPISNILLLPINLLNTILTKTNSTCSPISIPFLFNTTISFPCFTISDYLGSTANVIDLCICFVMIYNILMLFVSVFEDITTLRDGFLSLYEPRHAYSGYHPKHGKD